MADLYVFSDEAGELAFHQRSNRYFIITTVTMADCAAGDGLLQLRRQLAWEGVTTHPDFRCSEELQPVRDRVFAQLQWAQFRVDATIFDKPKARPDLYRTTDSFYRYAWYFHFRYVAQRIITPQIERLLVVPATIAASREKQELFSAAVRKVVAQVAGVDNVRYAFWRASSEPCLWVADYCSWAIQRKWEHTWQGQPDDRSHRLIGDKIHSEFDIFARGIRRYYELQT